MTQTTKLQSIQNDRARQAALALMREGLATHTEIADLAGTSRQLVRFWALRAGVDIGATRAAYLAREWRKRLAE